MPRSFKHGNKHGGYLKVGTAINGMMAVRLSQRALLT